MEKTLLEVSPEVDTMAIKKPSTGQKRLNEAYARLDRVAACEVIRSRANGEIRFGDVWLIATTKGGGPCSVPEEISLFLEKSTNDMWLFRETIQKLQEENEALREFAVQASGQSKCEVFNSKPSYRESFIEGIIKGVRLSKTFKKT